MMFLNNNFIYMFKENNKRKSSKNFSGYMKNVFTRKKGFTLVELLLVMAIIGILAGVIMTGMIASRKRAKVSSALKTANSVVAELADCYLRGEPIENADVSSVTADTKICNGAGNWPSLNGNALCDYEGYQSEVLGIKCGSVANIVCQVKKGHCSVHYNN